VTLHRREFLAASTAAAVSLRELESTRQAGAGQHIELRRDHLLPGSKQRAFSDFVGEMAIPAMNRAGIERVGAFSVLYGENAPSLILVLAHSSARAGAAIP
jgi:hypothetical protein